MDADEIVAAFDLERVTHAAAAFDHQKLDWMNGEWIRRLPLEELVRRVEPVAKARFADGIDETILHAAVGIGQERAVTLASLVDQMDFLFVDEDSFEIAPDSWERSTKVDRAAEVLGAAIAHLERCDWSVDAIDLRPALDQLGVKPRKAMPALYAAVEGRHAGLPLFDSIFLLERDRALGRLRAARERLDGT
jgi:glutamyl-tRNA synthetase